MLTNIKMKLINLRNIFQKICRTIIWSIFVFFLCGQSWALNIISDEETETVIKQLVAPVVKAAGFQPDQINFYIVLDPQINAFVYGGNNIFLNTGLIALFNDPDVIRGVVSHELGHIVGSHAIRQREQMKELMPQAIATGMLGIAAALAGSPEAGAATMLGGGHTVERSMLRNSRENESSADQVAIRTLHESHHTNRGLLKLLNYFLTNNKTGDISPYALTHPVSIQRIDAIKNSNMQHSDDYPATEEEKKKYSLVVAKLRGFIDPVDDVINRKETDLDTEARQYELSIAYYRKANIAKSLSYIDQLITNYPTNPYFYELKGQFLFDNGQATAAVDSYKKALEILPQSGLIKIEYATALINASTGNMKEQLNKAVSVLQSATVRQNDNPTLYRNLGIAYGKLGNYAQSNIMLAKAAILQNNYNEAKKFIYNAKKYAKNDQKYMLQIADLEDQTS